MPETKSTAAPRLKLVIRRLPPTIPEDIFWKSISPWIDDGKSTWKKWYQGKKFDEYASFLLTYGMEVVAETSFICRCQLYPATSCLFSRICLDGRL